MNKLHNLTIPIIISFIIIAVSSATAIGLLSYHVVSRMVA